MDSDWSSSADLLVGLDRTKGLRDGIEHALREAMRDGRLVLGAVLPSSRALASDLGVARGTVSAAYAQLAAEGYLTIRQGAPVRVSWLPQHPRALPHRAPRQPAPRWDLRPGRPDSASFPRHAWAKAHRTVMARAADEIFGYGDPAGDAELRRVLADYLGRARGVDTDPARLLICNGFAQALTLICLVLRAAGTSTLAVEDPSTPRYGLIAAAAGLTLVPVPCDEQGLQADYLARTGARAVLVTPAHQYPLGLTMSAARRTALVEWARRHQALIIEDDYDGEFRYDRQPVGALQYLDPEHVIYIGTASKALAPGLRLGWVSPPGTLCESFATAKDRLDRGTSALEQRTFAEFISAGAFDRHIRRMRAVYHRRRDDLEKALADNCPDLRLAGVSAGMHALIHLPSHGPSEHQVRSRAARQSIALHTLDRYWHNPLASAPQAIIVGYGTPAGHAYQPALDALIRLLARASPGAR